MAAMQSLLRIGRNDEDPLTASFGPRLFSICQRAGIITHLIGAIDEAAQRRLKRSSCCSVRLRSLSSARMQRPVGLHLSAEEAEMQEELRELQAEQEAEVLALHAEVRAAVLQRGHLARAPGELPPAEAPEAPGDPESCERCRAAASREAALAGELAAVRGQLSRGAADLAARRDELAVARTEAAEVRDQLAAARAEAAALRDQLVAARAEAAAARDELAAASAELAARDDELVAARAEASGSREGLAAARAEAAARREEEAATRAELAAIREEAVAARAEAAAGREAAAAARAEAAAAREAAQEAERRATEAEEEAERGAEREAALAERAEALEAELEGRGGEAIRRLGQENVRLAEFVRHVQTSAAAMLHEPQPGAPEAARARAALLAAQRGARPDEERAAGGDRRAPTSGRSTPLVLSGPPTPRERGELVRELAAAMAQEALQGRREEGPGPAAPRPSLSPAIHDLRSHLANSSAEISQLASASGSSSSSSQAPTGGASGPARARLVVI
eukprot:tig00000622_g2636.t1